jgi:mannose-6-phosphate isomerase-like protein (cupin superfamily)
MRGEDSSSPCRLRSERSFDNLLPSREGGGEPVSTMTPPATTAAPVQVQKFAITQLDEVPAVKCPCGFSRRAFATPDNPVATIHLVDIQTDAQTHYHKKLTEIYLILEGEGFMELDGQLYPVKPMTSILIKPGCRHRAVGKMKIVNIPVPAFDPHDEWFD